MMNYNKSRNRQGDRWALLANNIVLNSPKDDVNGEVVRCLYSRSDSFGFVQTALCRYFISI